MTDRVRTVQVILDKSYRDDDVAEILAAIKMIKGVDSVAIVVETLGDRLARATAKNELRREILDAVYDLLKLE